MTMENPPFEDVFPIENGDFPMSFVSFHGVRFLGHVLQKGHLKSTELPSMYLYRVDDKKGIQIDVD